MRLDLLRVLWLAGCVLGVGIGITNAAPLGGSPWASGQVRSVSAAQTDSCAGHLLTGSCAASASAQTGASVAAAFRLHDLPNCIVSIRPRVGTVTLNGADVAQIDDETGRGNTARQATASLQPVYSSSGGGNNKPYFETDGVTEFLEIDDTGDMDPGTGSWWCLSVGSWIAAAGTWCVWGGKGSAASANNWRLMHTGTDRLGVWWGSDAQNYDYDTNPIVVTDTTPAAWIWGIDAVAATRILGKNTTYSTVAVTVSGTGSNANKARLGMDISGGYAVKIRVSELVWFAVPPTGNALTLAQWYLATEYSL